MPTVPISGFAATDKIDLAAVAYTSTGSATFSDGILTVTEGGQSYALDLPDLPNGTTFTLLTDGSSGTLVVNTANSTIGTGQNFWGFGGHNVFLRSGSGQLTAEEFASNGSAIDAQALTYQGSPWTIDATARVLNSGYNVNGSGGSDLSVLSGSGQLNYADFNAAGQLTHLS